MSCSCSDYRSNYSCIHVKRAVVIRPEPGALFIFSLFFLDQSLQINIEEIACRPVGQGDVYTSLVLIKQILLSLQVSKSEILLQSHGACEYFKYKLGQYMLLSVNTSK
jgi:hypothetical protein